MDQTDSSTKTAKGKHMTALERRKIKKGLKQRKSPYRIAKELGRAQGTILAEIKRGTDPENAGRVKHSPRLGKRVYRKNRKNCHMPLKIGQCEPFVKAVVNRVKIKGKCGFDPYVGRLKKTREVSREHGVDQDQYSYLERGLLDILAIDLPPRWSGSRPSRTARGRTRPSWEPR